jgi:hypothetical protein
MWSDDESVVVEAFTRMRAAEFREVINNDQFLGAVGYANVVLVMARWKKSLTIQALGCLIMRGTQFEMHKHAASVGALEVVLSAMKQFPEDKDLTASAMLALYNLCTKSPANMMRLVEKMDALPAIFESMQQFTGDRLVSSACCRLIMVLSMKHQFVSALVDAGGLTVLGDIYTRWLHSTDESERKLVELARVSLAGLVTKHT